MGISELDALALIFGGAVLVHRFYTRELGDILALLFLALGIAMLIFGVADIIADEL